MYAINTIMQEC